MKMTAVNTPNSKGMRWLARPTKRTDERLFRNYGLAAQPLPAQELKGTRESWLFGVESKLDAFFHEMWGGTLASSVWVSINREAGTVKNRRNSDCCI